MTAHGSLRVRLPSGARAARRSRSPRPTTACFAGMLVPVEGPWAVGLTLPPTELVHRRGLATGLR